MADVIHVDNMQLFIQKLLPRLMESFRGCRLVALKIHFGEPGNKFAFRPDQIKPECSFTVDLGASSVQSVELVAAFEEEFDIEMEEDAALSVETVGKAIEYIASVCKEQGVNVEI